MYELAKEKGLDLEVLRARLRADATVRLSASVGLRGTVRRRPLTVASRSEWHYPAAQEGLSPFDPKCGALNGAYRKQLSKNSGTFRVIYPTFALINARVI